MNPGAAPGLRTRAVGAVLGAMFGATVWISGAALALVDPERMTRVGVLWPWAWLAGLAVAGAAVGAVLRPPAVVAAPAVLGALLWLPWLPWQVPSAFLLWDGPLEGVVWAAIAGGMLWAGSQSWRARAAASGVWRSPSSAPWLAGGLAAVLCATAWGVDRPRVPAGDEPHYLVITQSLLNDGDLRIEDNHTRGDYLAYYDGVLKPDFMRRGVDGQIYSIHAPGVSVVVLPAFAAAGYGGAVLTIVVIAGLAVAAVWRAAYGLTDSVAAAWMASLAASTAAPLLLHGFTVYPDPVGAACVMAGVGVLVTLARGRPVSLRWLAVVGAALALLPWLHTRFAVIAASLALVLAGRLLARGDRWRALAAFAAVPAVAAAAWFAFFWRLYGTPNPAAPYGAVSGASVSFVPAGLAGLLLDQQFGLAANAPVLLLGLVLLAPLARRDPRLAGELVVVVAPYLVVAASYGMWWGGYSAPARFAVAVLPVMTLPLAEAWARGGALRRGVVAAGVAVSAATSALLVTVDRGAFVYNDRDGHALLLDWLSPTVDLTLAFPSVHRDGPWLAASDTLAWMAALTFVGALVARIWRAGPGRPWARASAWLAVPLALMLGATMGWAGLAADVRTAATSQLAWIGRTAALPGAGVQGPPVRLVERGDLVTRLELATNPRGGRRTGPQPLLRIPFVPAGEYDVFIEPRDRGVALDGTLTVRLGRHDLPLETWTLAGRPRGYTGLALHLPVEAHSITITGDAAARDTIARLVLRPRALTGGALPLALRAVRIGRVVVFALDDRAYLEPGAFWVAGERETTVVLAAGDRPPAMRLTAGPVPTHVDLRAGGFSRGVDLAAGASETVSLPAVAVGGAPLTIASSTGFRPSATDDVRWLGVYVTFPE